MQIFTIWLQSPQQKCSWVLIFAFQCRETTPTNSFACEIPVSAWGSVLIITVTALPSKNVKFCTPRKFPAIIMVLHVIIQHKESHVIIMCFMFVLICCIPCAFLSCVHITPFIGQLVSTTCGGCGMLQTHEKRFLPTTESV